MGAPAVMIDGQVVPSGATVAVPLDDGLVRGDGVFEGLRSYDRRLRDPDAHLRRMARSAARVALEFPHAALADDLHSVASARRRAARPVGATRRIFRFRAAAITTSA